MNWILSTACAAATPTAFRLQLYQLLLGLGTLFCVSPKAAGTLLTCMNWILSTACAAAAPTAFRLQFWLDLSSPGYLSRFLRGRLGLGTIWSPWKLLKFGSDHFFLLQVCLIRLSLKASMSASLVTTLMSSLFQSDHSSQASCACTRNLLAGQIRGQMSVCRAWNALPNNEEHKVEAIMEPFRSHAGDRT